MSLKTWLRGMALLRHPELLHFLGKRRFELMQLHSVQDSFPAARISDDVVLIAYHSKRLELAENVYVGQGTILAFGDEANGFGSIRVGSGSWIGQNNNLRACGYGGDIVIGNHCLISQFCTMVGSNHNITRHATIREQGPDRSRTGVMIGDDVWLGAGVAIMPGVRVGEGAVIGANATVTKSVPAYEIWGGVPAKKIGERE